MRDAAGGVGRDASIGFEPQLQPVCIRQRLRLQREIRKQKPSRKGNSFENYADNRSVKVVGDEVAFMSPFLI